MLTVKELYSYLDEKIPQALSSSWDNDGLMVCEDENREVKKVLLSLDITDKVAEHAAENGFDVIISHHPLIFKPLKNLSNMVPQAKRALVLIKNGISAMSFHTRLDSVDGGINDLLCQTLEIIPKGRFGPVGEEIGRIGTFEIPRGFDSFASHVKSKLGAPATAFTRARDYVSKIAVLGGDGGDFIEAAIKSGADTFITGSAGYNDMLEAMAAGLSVIEAGHYYTEAIFAMYFERVIPAKYEDIEIKRCPVGCEIQYK